MMLPTLIFIHQTSPFPVAYAAEHAAKIGYNVIVVGEESWDFKQCTNLSMCQFRNGIDRFNDIYKHQSPNTAKYESFCFERWFILRNVMATYRLDNVFYIDSDALVFKGFESIVESTDYHSYEIPFFNFFKDLNSLEIIVSSILDIYEDPDFKEKYCIATKEYSSFFSDMILFPWVAKKYPNSFSRIAKNMEDMGFDRNINKPGEYQSFGNTSSGIKRIEKRGDEVWGKTRNGQERQFFFLHFQGHSKPLMQFYLNGSIEDYSKSWWPNPGTPDVIRAHSVLSNLV